MTIIKQDAYYRQVHAVNYKRVRPGKRFQRRIFKKLRAAGIFNFIEMQVGNSFSRNHLSIKGGSYFSVTEGAFCRRARLKSSAGCRSKFAAIANKSVPPVSNPKERVPSNCDTANTPKPAAKTREV